VKTALLLICCISLVSAFGCSSLRGSAPKRANSTLHIVTLCNTYVPTSAPAPIEHNVAQVRQFNRALASAGIEGASLANESKEDFSHAEFIQAIERHDGAGTLTIAYIASHGSPEGLILPENLGFEELYRRLESETKGKVLLIVDSCYSGLINGVLERHGSSRIFAITGTRGGTVERWYSESGNFGQAVSNTISEKAMWGRDRSLTLGSLFDGVEEKIKLWNVRNRHSSGHITDPGMYGPRDLVILDF
jgi:hypothetical protein